MSTNPAVNPNTTPGVPDFLGTFSVCSGKTVGPPSSKCEGLPAVPQKLARWKASMYWVAPILAPPDVKRTDEEKMGDATVFCVIVFPLDSFVEGSKVVPSESTILIGIRNVLIVAELLGNGGTPTML